MTATTTSSDSHPAMMAHFTGSRPGVERSARRRLSAGAPKVAVVLAAVLSAGAAVTLAMTTHGAAHPQVVSSRAGGSGTEGTDVDPDAIADAVRHRMVEGDSGTLVSDDAGYRTTFDARGVTIAPHGLAGDEAGISSTVRRGSSSIAVAPGPWRGRSNVARRSLGDGIVEEVTATDGQLEWDFVLRSPVAGTGALRIKARVTGATRSPQRGGGGWRWDLRDELRLAMGDVLVEDLTGAEIYRALPRAVRNSVSVTVPAAVLQAAGYPLTIDRISEHPRAARRAAPERAIGTRG